MGTLRGFPCPPAHWLRRAKPASANATMGTLRGLASHSAPASHPPAPALRAASPCPRHPPPAPAPPRCARPRAHWLRRAKPASANATMGTLRGLASHSAPASHPPAPALRAASPCPRHPPPAQPAPALRAASRALASAGKARLRQRDDGNPQRVSFALGTRLPPACPRAARGLAMPSAPASRPPAPALRAASRALASAGKARLRQRDDGNPQRVPPSGCSTPGPAGYGVAGPVSSEPTRHARRSIPFANCTKRRCGRAPAAQGTRLSRTTGPTPTATRHTCAC